MELRGSDERKHFKDGEFSNPCGETAGVYDVQSTFENTRASGKFIVEIRGMNFSVDLQDRA